MTKYFCTDSLEMARLGIKMTANYTVKARRETIGSNEVTILIEVNEVGMFNAEIFIKGEENQYFDHICNFNNLHNCIIKADQFVEGLELNR